MKHSDASDANKERSQEKESREDFKQKVVSFMTIIHNVLQEQDSSVATVTSLNSSSKAFGQELKDTSSGVLNKLHGFQYSVLTHSCDYCIEANNWF
jgi:hypothetical protein